MNPTAPPPPQPPQPPPLQPHRSSISCDRHPEENFTGFCPSCLCERLAVLDPNSSTASASASSTRKPPSSSTAAAAAALKAIFRPSSSSSAAAAAGRNNKPPTSSFLPELRRTKSFSASKNEAFSGAFEPQRKSCDVRARSSLWNLFNPDNNEKKTLNKEEVDTNTRNLASSSIVTEQNVVENEDKDEITVLEEPKAGNVNVTENRVQEKEIVEEEEGEEEEDIKEEELKTMKDHIDLDSSHAKKSSRDFKVNFWSAASVFSKKLQKWRLKKMKKHSNGNDNGNGSGNNDDGSGSVRLPVEKPISRQFRETQSEIADYGYGRRSCDTDPRFSLDIGRMSFEDPRYSLDEPRASWDGYLIGRTTTTSFPKMPTMLSVVEDAPVNVNVNVNVSRSDTQIPVEEEEAINENNNDGVPGGTTQTREYYSDSSSRRRKSLDRSNSMKKLMSSTLVTEMDENKTGGIVNTNVNNVDAKVTPASVDYIHGGAKLGFLDRDLRDFSSVNSMTMRDDCSETFELGFRDGDGDRKGSKKSRRGRWSKGWSIWGLIHRRGGNKDEDDDRYSRGTNGVERSFSESWQELRGDNGNGDGRGGFNGRILRSNSSVSWRNAQSVGGSFGTSKKNGTVQGKGHGKKGKDEFVLERNRSARYSPNNNIDSGLLRLYLTPMRGSHRNGSMKSKSNQAPPIARSLPRVN